MIPKYFHNVHLIFKHIERWLLRPCELLPSLSVSCLSSVVNFLYLVLLWNQWGFSEVKRKRSHLKSLYSDTKILSNYIPSLYFFLSMCDIHFTEFGAVMTTVLPVLFKYCYKYCYSDNRKLWAVMKGGGLAL
jgi:hypothetical protein